eukprot:COSAG02_NODE_60790_length_270_cov_0.818713_1_plen_44_part_01
MGVRPASNLSFVTRDVLHQIPGHDSCVLDFTNWVPPVLNPVGIP